MAHACSGPHSDDEQPAVAFLPWADRFEDFHDKIGVSLDELRDRLTGTWLFNYVEALQAVGVRPVLYFVSARIPGVLRFVHRPTGAPIRFVPAPWLHRKLQGARDLVRMESRLLSSVLAYVATPWLTLARELRRDGCKAILCQEYEYPRFDEAVMLGHALQIPVFATYQAGNVPGSALESLFRRTAIRRAAGLVIGSRIEIQRVRSAYGVPAERTAFVPNAVDVRRWRPADRQAARAVLGIPGDVRVVTWHGRVEIHRKGLDLLLDAWERLYAERPGARRLLLLVGSGQDASAFQRRVASLPNGTVRWENRYILDHDRLWQYLSAADVATLPSRHEGFAVAVIEAMACGLPVVATDVSGVAEALGEEPVGLIVPREDAGALAQALGRLLDDEPLRRELGERARRRAEAEFSLQVVGSRLRAFMEERGAFGRLPEVGRQMPTAASGAAKPRGARR
jgi:glycosyltransferase involved in cell wall biosynthesis